MRRFGAALSACALVVLLGAGVAAYGANEVPVLTVKPGTLTGTLSTSKGEPLAEKTMVLMQDGKAVGAVLTNDKGQYMFEGLEPGAYDIVVPGAPPFKIIVTPEATTSILMLMTPGAAAPAAGGAAAGEPLLTKTQWVWVGVGAGAVAVAVPLIAAGGGGGGGGGGGISD